MMMPPADLALPFGPAGLIAILAAALAAGLARGFSGFGAALIFIPLASAVAGPKIASPLLLIVDALLTLGLLPDAWRRADRKEVATMAAGAAAGVPLGVAALAMTDPLALRWATCAVVALLLAFLLSGWRYAGRPKPAPTVAVGALAGLFSGAAQLGGPPVVAYWLGRAMPGRSMRANVVLYFAASSVFSFIGYAAAGLLTSPVLLLAAVTAPAYAVGLFAGARLFGLADERTFRTICLALIAAAAVAGLPLLDGVLR